MEWLNTQYQNLKSAFATPVQKTVDAMPLPKVATSEAPKVLGTAPEAPGTARVRAQRRGGGNPC